MLSVVMLNVIMLNAIMLNVIMLNVIMLNVVMLNVIMLSFARLNVVMLSVVALKFTALIFLKHGSRNLGNVNVIRALEKRLSRHSHKLWSYIIQNIKFRVNTNLQLYFTVVTYGKSSKGREVGGRNVEAV
jgi:hypothetical protein